MKHLKHPEPVNIKRDDVRSLSNSILSYKVEQKKKKDAAMLCSESGLSSKIALEPENYSFITRKSDEFAKYNGIYEKRVVQHSSITFMNVSTSVIPIAQCTLCLYLCLYYDDDLILNEVFIYSTVDNNCM